MIMIVAKNKVRKDKKQDYLKITNSVKLLPNGKKMALQLNAEQKYILKIFEDRTKYVIPPYQRAYSWTENECEELFEDLKNAYYTNKNEGYFLGNIILSTTNRDEFEVIDGQQRLTTLIMFLKVLCFGCQDRHKPVFISRGGTFLIKLGD